MQYFILLQIDSVAFHVGIGMFFFFLRQEHKFIAEKISTIFRHLLVTATLKTTPRSPF